VSIANYDQLVAGLLPPSSFDKAAGTAEAAGEYFSAWYLTGRPGAGVAPSSGLNGAALTATVSGQLPTAGTVTGKQAYLASMRAAQGGNVGTVRLLDRLYANSGYTVTSTGSQASTHAGLPSRDSNGSNTGAGVGLALEVSTATTNAGVVTATISYTNESGVAGRTGTITVPITAVAGHWAEMDLQAGDFGVRSFQSLTLSASLVTGAIHLVQFREITAIDQPADNRGDRMSPLECFGPVYDGSVLALVYLATGTAVGRVRGGLRLAQG